MSPGALRLPWRDRPQDGITAQVDGWMATLAAIEPREAQASPEFGAVVAEIAQGQERIAEQLGKTQRTVRVHGGRLEAVEQWLRAGSEAPAPSQPGPGPVDRGPVRTGSGGKKPGTVRSRRPASGGSSSYGTVKWFNAEEGTGLIAVDDGSVGIFANFSSIAIEGYRGLEENQKVEFEIIQGPKGPQASNIRPL